MNTKQFLNNVVLFSLLLVAPLSSNEAITLNWLEDKPRSVTKDFYIWQFLQQDITPDEAAYALGEAKNVNFILFTNYAKKFKHDETYAIVECVNAQAVDLIHTSSDCLAVGLTPTKAITLDYGQKLQAIDILQNKYPKEITVLNVLNAPLPFTKLVATPPELFFEIFNKTPISFVEHYFNYRLSASFLDKISSFNAFNQTVQRIVANDNLNNLQESLLGSFNTAELNHQSLFFLALNALKHEQNELAMHYLEEASKKAYLKRSKDKILFWQYKITQNDGFLEELSNSYDINLYSLYAKELLDKKPNNILFTVEIEQTDAFSTFDVTNPFDWVGIVNELKSSTIEQLPKYEKLFNTNETLPHLAVVLEKLSNHQMFYYITPYAQYFENYDVKRQALLYALAKQESQFIPTAISPSYALGAMQIMPFLSKHIAQELKESYNIYDQFNPKVNLKYANFHVDYLEKNLKNPLFIAYAYNGGIGFMKRTLEKGFLKNKNELEPFLSMELMSNEESREYGKQVLANYYIYLNHLDKDNPVKLSTLLESVQNKNPN